jgi:hypothetical protein
VEPHHFNADSDSDFLFDADPYADQVSPFHSDADPDLNPDPSFQTTAHILEKVL